MTEAVRPNIFERARNGLANRWNDLRERFTQRAEDFAVNQAARNVLFAEAAIPRIERVRDYFSGGVREVANNLWRSIRGAADALGQRIEQIPEQINTGARSFRQESERCGVAPTLVNRIGSWVERTAQSVFIDIPVGRMDRQADRASAKVDAIDFIDRQGLFDKYPRMIDAAFRVSERLMRRRDQLRTRAEEIRDARVGRLQEAIDRLNNGRPWASVGVLPEDLLNL